jgi:hypothetical protein
LISHFEGWTAYLAAKDIEIVTDDLGRLSISRTDARRLFDERREAEARKGEAAAAAEAAAIKADQQYRSTLWGGLPWYELPGGLSPAQALGRRSWIFLTTRTVGRFSTPSPRMRSES